ncbi:Histone H2A.Z-specific chaperone [Collariella sp. IMI 366227]|nr:Histone H2A.Z-specific chaperone [Collariella sp. IMI 366227]
MTSENGEPMAITPTDTGAAQATEFKGKGKASAEQQHAEDASMVEDDDDDDEEEEEAEEEPEAADEDNMEEIDLDNVIGRRTRGKVIDFAKAAAENPPDEDDDEEDDDDFQGEAEDDKMDED